MMKGYGTATSTCRVDFADTFTLCTCSSGGK
jgi:hypothetical protein